MAEVLRKETLNAHEVDLVMACMSGMEEGSPLHTFLDYVLHEVIEHEALATASVHPTGNTIILLQRRKQSCI